MLDVSYVQPPNDYPTGDGKPMAETDDHREQMVELISTLKHHFRNNSHAYVSGNLLWFYQQGDRRRHVSPDVLVRIGAPRGNRLNYLQWLEGGAPQVVIELTSKSTRREDTGRKFELYQNLGVEEYYLFDPLNEYLKPRFRCFHRYGSQLLPRLGEVIYSPALGLEFLTVNEKLRLRDPHSRRLLETAELELALAECQRADEETERAEQERARAQEERAKAEEERQRADAATQRALQAEEEVRRLRALLEKR